MNKKRPTPLHVSIVVLTSNEEINLPDCLGSVRWCDDVHVVDSGSTDRTGEIARARGAHWTYHPFVSFAEQRNWALENCGVKYEWIFFLDADERATDTFTEALREAIDKADDSVAGFYCCSRTILSGRWLKRADAFPKWQFRVMRAGRAEFTDYGHGQREMKVKGEKRYVREPYTHYPFNKGWAAWWTRHNRYSGEEARMRVRERINWKDIFYEDGSGRNKALKPFVSRLPGWPVLRFIADYLVRGGFLEGYPGFIYCASTAYYELLIQLKMAGALKKVIRQ